MTNDFTHAARFHSIFRLRVSLIRRALSPYILWQKNSSVCASFHSIAFLFRSVSVISFNVSLLYLKP